MSLIVPEISRSADAPQSFWKSSCPLLIPGRRRIAALLRTLPVACAALIAGLIFTASGAFAQGCAMCGTVVSSSSDPLGRGLALSIAFMLAAPNLLVASIGGWLFYVYRRAARAAAGTSAQGLAPGSPEPVNAGPSGPHQRENGRE